MLLELFEEAEVLRLDGEVEARRRPAGGDQLHLAPALLQQIVAVEERLAAHDARRRPGHQAHEAEARHALAGSRFADEPERLGLPQREGDAVHRLDRPPVGDDVGAEIANVDEGDQSWRSLGSRVPRTRSPRRLKASTTSRIARPGKSDTHHALVTTDRKSVV